MDLHLQQQFFIVSGASAGLGFEVAYALLAEGASILAIARTEEKLLNLQQKYPERVELLVGDIAQHATLERLMKQINGRQVHGMLVNAGGPPATNAMQATLEQWDEAYASVFRWKVACMQSILPSMIAHQYGRLVFIESVSIKQPVENLVLSTSMRLAVAGYAKTLSQELAHLGITVNILAPGYHGTQAMDRLFAKKSEQMGIDTEQAKKVFIEQIPAGFLGNPSDFASLGVWLLSPNSRFITGQTICVEGGLLKGLF